jgi:hypothetical protein
MRPGPVTVPDDTELARLALALKPGAPVEGDFIVGALWAIPSSLASPSLGGMPRSL